MALPIRGPAAANNSPQQRVQGGEGLTLPSCCRDLLSARAGDRRTIAEHIGATLGPAKVAMDWQKEKNLHQTFMGQSANGRPLWTLVQEHFDRNHPRPDPTNDAHVFWRTLVDRKKSVGAPRGASSAAAAPTNPALAAHRGQSGFG